MSILLTDVLKQLDLKPGDCRCVVVDDYEVEIRRPRLVVQDEGPMVDIWLNVPPSPDAVTFVVTAGPPQLPSPIEITESDLAPRMIYRIPTIEEPLDQGDILDECPGPVVAAYVSARADQSKVALELHRVIVLTQTCDLANSKADLVVVASVFGAQLLIDRGILKAADVKGPIRSGRTFGLYFLPAFAQAGIGELIVDFRRLFSIGTDVFADLVRSGKRRARLLTPYREHLAKHFADTNSRIGLP